MPSNVTHRFVSPILWKLNQPLYSSAIQHVFAVAVVYTHRSVPPIEWRGDKYIEGYRPLSSSSPDLLMECISDKSVFYTSQERIAVECKWRSKKNFFLDEKCIIKYEDYISSDEHKSPPKHLFYVFGFGWSCDNPEVVYVIPAKKLYNYSKEKHKVKFHFRKEDVDRLELFDDYKHKNTSKYLIYKPATEQSNI